jgi:hypothetical protein
MMIWVWMLLALLPIVACEERGSVERRAPVGAAGDMRPLPPARNRRIRAERPSRRDAAASIHAFDQRRVEERLSVLNAQTEKLVAELAAR